MHLKSVTLKPELYPAGDCYPFNVPALKHAAPIVFETPVTCFVGENGTGKSTLLEAIAVACGIHIWRNLERSRPDYNPYEGALHRYISIDWVEDRVTGSFFGSDIFRNFAEILDEWAAADRGQLKYFGGRSLTTQSHGQSLMAYFKSRYSLRGLYFLDEPETALSPRSQIELLNLIAQMGAAGHAQFLIATHSPILMSSPGATIFSFDHAPLRTLLYEETEHYRLYKEFMENRINLLANGNAHEKSS